MERYDPKEEFGIDEETYRNIIENVTNTFETWATEGSFEDYDFQEFKEDECDVGERFDFFDNPEYELVKDLEMD